LVPVVQGRAGYFCNAKEQTEGCEMSVTNADIDEAKEKP